MPTRRNKIANSQDEIINDLLEKFKAGAPYEDNYAAQTALIDDLYELYDTKAVFTLASYYLDPAEIIDLFQNDFERKVFSIVGDTRQYAKTASKKGARVHKKAETSALLAQEVAQTIMAGAPYRDEEDLENAISVEADKALFLNVGEEVTQYLDDEDVFKVVDMFKDDFINDVKDKLGDLETYIAGGEPEQDKALDIVGKIQKKENKNMRKKKALMFAPEIRDAVEDYLGEYADDYDIDTIVETIRDLNIDSIDDIDPDDFINILQDNDKTASRKRANKNKKKADLNSDTNPDAFYDEHGEGWYVVMPYDDFGVGEDWTAEWFESEWQLMDAFDGVSDAYNHAIMSYYGDGELPDDPNIQPGPEYALGSLETEMSNIEKAYNRGHKMGAYIINRDGIKKAIERGSLGNIVYRMPSMVKAYDDGYNAAVNESKRAAKNNVKQSSQVRRASLAARRRALRNKK